jgi:hypothetical protein
MQSKYTEERVRSEINAVLDQLQARGEAVQPQWVTHEICSRHRAGLAVLGADAPTAQVDDRDFWEYAGYAQTRKLTTRCVNEREQPDARADNPVLPGFEYLHHYYVHTRDGVDVMVPIEQSTDDELLAKAATYETLAASCTAHATELRRYVDWRRAQAAG